jgi:D-inositol-3-phosphate glycosyltransferase
MKPASDAARRRLVAVGWQVLGTGLTRVFRGLLAELSGDWTIDVAGIGTEGPVRREGGISIHPTVPGGRDTFGLAAARELIETIHPDVILCHHDLWILARYARQLGPVRGDACLAAYLPLDGMITDETLAEPLLDFDLVITYTDWARREVENAWRRLGATHRPRLEVLPHGLDRVAFQADPDLVASDFDPAARSRARAEVFRGRLDPDPAFVVLNASRPAIRKRLDLTLEGFARFARTAPDDAMLCLHHAVTDHDHNENLQQLIRRHGLGRRVILNPLGSRVLSDQELNLLYQACDVGLNTSTGEGWGLISFEHGAAGGAQIVPAHSACAELWDDAAELLPIVRRFVPDYSPLQMAEVSPEGIGDALSRLHRNPELLRRRSRQAHGLATNRTPTWKDVGERLRDILDEAV